MSKKKHDVGVTITTKTPYGTTSDMVVSEGKTPDTVIAKDDIGTYETKKSHVDNGLADPYRFSRCK